MTNLLRGTVQYGINNIFTVEVEGKALQCRIKGKVIQQEDRTHNPIAVGDIVDVKPDPILENTGWITDRQTRRSWLSRWNTKTKAPQVIAANCDLLVAVTSPQSPPFRPRFVDRLIIAAETGNLEPIIVINKCDLTIDRSTQDRLLHYEKLGYRVIKCSALLGSGIDAIGKVMLRQVAVFVGQSGVGKSSILNRMDPQLSLKIGDISTKYDRGAHTTSHAVLLRLEGNHTIIDTPGIRELHMGGIHSGDLWYYFKELRALQEGCSYSPCFHVNEPGCCIKEALQDGQVHPDRYASYVRLYRELQEHEKSSYFIQRRDA